MHIEGGAVAGRGNSKCKGPEAGECWGVGEAVRRLPFGWGGAQRGSGRGRDPRGVWRYSAGPVGCGEDSGLYSV